MAWAATAGRSRLGPQFRTCGPAPESGCTSRASQVLFGWELRLASGTADHQPSNAVISTFHKSRSGEAVSRAVSAIHACIANISPRLSGPALWERNEDTEGPMRLVTGSFNKGETVLGKERSSRVCVIERYAAKLETRVDREHVAGAGHRAAFPHLPELLVSGAQGQLHSGAKSPQHRSPGARDRRQRADQDPEGTERAHALVVLTPT